MFLLLYTVFYNYVTLVCIKPLPALFWWTFLPWYLNRMLFNTLLRFSHFHNSSNKETVWNIKIFKLVAVVYQPYFNSNGKQYLTNVMCICSSWTSEHITVCFSDMYYHALNCDDDGDMIIMIMLMLIIIIIFFTFVVCKTWAKFFTYSNHSSLL